MKHCKPKNFKPIKGRGFVGVWADGRLGWCMPKHFDSKSGGNHPKGEYWNKGAPVYLCEITLKPIKDKLGRFITRYIVESQ